MVVPVQEYQGLLVHNNEECIKEFRKFAPDKKEHPESGTPASEIVFGIVAKRLLHRVTGEQSVKSRDGSQKANGRKGAEKEVPGRECDSEIPRLPRFKVFLSSANEKSVRQYSVDGYHGILCHPVEGHFGRKFLFEPVRVW